MSTQYSTKEPPQYTQRGPAGDGVLNHNLTSYPQQAKDSLPAYSQRPNTNGQISASSTSDQESDIVSNYPENRVKQNECSACCQDLCCGGCFGCCTGPANMPTSDRNLMGTFLTALCCGAGVSAGLN
ncbi:hypothetical protein KGF57_004426 [Candida theae]|uniref:Uncharacterized protein n=1 Tax=Candida theae TaxID=1198502 RepID=A0AAD5FWZ6_9ASCO|nr:uncharacterized protein KGF57_004426 [Candida theae]KAI5950080.1 hypothetical protein KGF57_004426 [Candida theae]